MKKQTLLLTLSLLSLPLFAQTKEATILKVSKTINEKNVLHYKVNYNEETCEIDGPIYAEWKMDEEDGRWKPLSESMGMIKGPLEPKLLSQTPYEIEFATEAISEFQEKKILFSDKVRVLIEEQNGKCQVKNEVNVQGETVNVFQLHSKVTIFGNIKWVIVKGRRHDGIWYEKKFKD